MPSTITDRLNGLSTSVAVKAPCRVATTANIALSGLQTIDGVILVSGDRVLVKNQTTAIDNGIWIASSGAWTRAADFDGTFDGVGGTQVSVTSGSVNARTYWRVDGYGELVIGTDSITFIAGLDGAEAGSFSHAASYSSSTVGKKLQQVIDPRDAPYNAAADGVADDTADIEAAATAAVAAGAVLRFAPGKTYKFSKITFPAGCCVEMKGATLRSDGSLTVAGDITVTVGNNCTFDELNVTTPGTETNTDIVSLGTNVKIGILDVRADAQRAGGGITCTGDNVKIRRLITRKIDRPIHLNNPSITTQTEESEIGFIDVEDYVRAFRADFCSFTVGGMRAAGRSANASKSAGHNGVLIVGCADWSMGDLWIEDAGEHAFRIGGSTGTYQTTKNYQIGVITAVRCGGCAFKANPTLETSAGVTEKAYNGSVKGVIGIDCGDDSLAGNEELLRLTHVNGLEIGFAYAYTDGDSASAQYLVQANDCNGVNIGSLGSENVNAGFVNFDGTSDVDGINQFGGDILGFRIGRLFGVTAGNNAIGVNTTFNVGRVHIGLDGIRGFATNVILWSAGTLTDDFELKGWVGGSVAPVYSGVTASDFFLVDVRYDNKRAIGRGASARSSVTHEFIVPTFDSADYADGANGVFLNNAQGTAGSGNYGGALEFSRVGSSRRGAAIVARQETADDKEVGLEFFTGDSAATATESLNSAMRLTKERSLAVPDGITAPSTMSGWAQIYVDTADGDLKVKFGDGTVKTIVVDT